MGNALKCVGIGFLALIYLISPIDLVPDFILGLGWVDDAVVVSWAAKTMGALLAGPSNHAA